MVLLVASIYNKLNQANLQYNQEGNYNIQSK